MIDVALALEQQILGPLRRAMPCGCVMRVVHRIDVSTRPYKNYSNLGFPVLRCDEHATNCPYINQRLDE